MALLDSTKNTMHGWYKQFIEGVTSAATKSEFLEKGTLTPEEFVIAGDKLVNQCPTWTWEEGDKNKKWSFLEEKQYLQTRNVPCLSRVASLGAHAHEHIVENGEWLEMEDEDAHQAADQIADIDLDNMQEIGNDKNKSLNSNANGNNNDKNSKIETDILANIVEHSAFNEQTDKNIQNQNNTVNDKNINIDNNNTDNNNNKSNINDNEDELSDSYEEIPDIETFNDEDNVVAKNTINETVNEKNDNVKNTDDKKNNSNNSSNNDSSNSSNTNNTDEEKKLEDKPMLKVKQEEDTIVKTRTYDISITYDKYYKVPRIWLRGYDENANPLTSSQIFEDISADHAHKTVTVEPHPHLPGVVCAGIHPCRHSEVMKRFMDRMEDSGNALTIDQYLFLFLKFMSSVIPTVEYDFTHSVDG